MPVDEAPVPAVAQSPEEVEQHAPTQGGTSTVISIEPELELQGMAEDLNTDDPGSAEQEEVEAGSTGKGKHKKVLSEQKLKRLKEEHERRGVVYVSRIPPHMKPMKLKQLLSQYGETLRVYCAPEDPRLRKLRKKKGGNTGKNFTEGWVEFVDKRVAKRVSLMLNGQRIGGKRRSAYFDDLWSVKYLKRFKWDHLTEEVSYQHAVREQRLATEISAAKRERDHYLAQVDRSKALAAMSERRAAKAAAGDTSTVPATKSPAVAASGSKRKAPSAATAGAGPGGAAGVAAAAASAGGAGVGVAGGAVVRNRGFRLRQPLAAPELGVASGRDLADDVLMMVARSKKPRLN